MILQSYVKKNKKTQNQSSQEKHIPDWVNKSVANQETPIDVYNLHTYTKSEKFNLAKTWGNFYKNKRMSKQGTLKPKLRNNSVCTDKKQDLSQSHKRTIANCTPDLLHITNADLLNRIEYLYIP